MHKGGILMNPIAKAQMSEEEKKYVDARNDILKAMKSIEDLNPQQREQLAKELLGIETFTAICKIMMQYGEKYGNR